MLQPMCLSNIFLHFSCFHIIVSYHFLTQSLKAVRNNMTTMILVVENCRPKFENQTDWEFVVFRTKSKHGQRIYFFAWKLRSERKTRKSHTKRGDDVLGEWKWTLSFLFESSRWEAELFMPPSETLFKMRDSCFPFPRNKSQNKGIRIS